MRRINEPIQQFRGGILFLTGSVSWLENGKVDFVVRTEFVKLEDPCDAPICQRLVQKFETFHLTEELLVEGHQIRRRVTFPERKPIVSSNVPAILEARPDSFALLCAENPLVRERLYGIQVCFGQTTEKLSILVGLFC